MTVRELYARLDERIPRSLSCEWDNDGLMCCPDGARNVKKVLIALDVTSEVVDKAVEGGYDCVISHHPFIFHGLKAIDDESMVSAKAIKLIRAGIAVMSFHTRLDTVEGGVNDTLCELLGIKNTSPVYDKEIPLGRVGELPAPISAEELAKRVKEVLGSPFVLVADVGVSCHRVAVVGGGGGSMIDAARAAGADTYISGRVDYHPMVDAPDHITAPINLLEAGHFYTETPVCYSVAKMIGEFDGDIVCDVYSNCNIKAI